MAQPAGWRAAALRTADPRRLRLGSLVLPQRLLLSDGSLSLAWPTLLTPLVRRWLPLRLPQGRPKRSTAIIRLRASSADFPSRPRGPSLLRLGTVHVYAGRTRFLLYGAQSTMRGIADPLQRRAMLHVDAGANHDEEVYYALAIATALLLGGQDRALIHGGALVRPSGGAWLLIGDSHAGKSSTIATAAAAGWDFISDDQIIAWESGNDLCVEGLLRRFHLDFGYGAGEVTGRRDRVIPQALTEGRWKRGAKLEGLLFPVVQADQPTRLERVTSGDALTGLIRQSPWLMADQFTADRILALFSRIATLPAYRLRLGLDSYNQPAALASILAALD